MDLNQLKTLNDAAIATFKELSARQRYRKDTNLRRFRKALSEKHGNIDLHQLEEVFKHMEELGLGSLVIGRDDKPTRFVWKYNLKDVAKAAATGQMPAKMLSGAKSKFKSEPTSFKPVNGGKAPTTSKIEVYILDGDKLKQYRVIGSNAEVVKRLLDGLASNS